jgi:hypothetical protein
MKHQGKELRLAGYYSWASWPCPRCNGPSVTAHASDSGPMELLSSNIKRPHEIYDISHYLMIPHIPKGGVLMTKGQEMSQEQDKPLIILILKTLKGEIARLTKMLTIWRDAFIHACMRNDVNFIHEISAPIHSKCF